MFGKDKKEKVKVTESVLENDELTRVSYSCNFARDDDRVVLEKTPVIRKFDKTTMSWSPKKYGKTVLVPISELGWTKSLESKIIVRREIADENSMTGTRELFFLQTLKYSVLDRYKWVYLKKENSRIYCKDFMNGGITFEAPKNSSSYIDVIKDSGVKVTQAEALKMAQNGEIDGYFDKITQDGNLTYYHKKVLSRDQKR